MQRASSSRRELLLTNNETSAAADVDVALPAPTPPASERGRKPRKLLAAFHSFLHYFPAALRVLLPSCREWFPFPVSPSGLRRGARRSNQVTGTVFGYRKGHARFAIQESPDSCPLLVLELGMATGALVREMASGLVRIALECERAYGCDCGLYQEPAWSMYCNGRKSGYAHALLHSHLDPMGAEQLRILDLVRGVSMGAGVLPTAGPGGQLMYMRANFERVVGSRDSEAFYMMSPDSSSATAAAGPELSIFLLRI